MDAITTILSTYLLVFAAEFGDKSQLVCLALATRHGARSVLTGAILAFTLLTGLAVILGSAMAAWIPAVPLHFAVAILFAIFGVQMLRVSPDHAEQPDKTWSNYVVLKTFMLIFVAEMADKTQLVAVGLSTVEPPSQVFVGATLALATTSALGVWAGSRFIQTQHLKLVHRLSALLFFVFALVAGYQGLTKL